MGSIAISAKDAIMKESEVDSCMKTSSGSEGFGHLPNSKGLEELKLSRQLFTDQFQ